MLEVHRPELTAHCQRMLGSPHDAEDAVQDTFLRAWRSRESFDRRSTLRTWLYRIATNVCLDALTRRRRRPVPMDPGPAVAYEAADANAIPRSGTGRIDRASVPGASRPLDPAEMVASRETVRQAFAVALRHLPPRQRAALVLCEVLRWRASEVAELLDTSAASVNSALQRARATLAARKAIASEATSSLDPVSRALLANYVEAFDRDDVDALAALARQDAVMCQFAAAV